MAGKPVQGLTAPDEQRTLFAVLAGTVLLCLFVAAATGYYLLAALPALLLVAYQAVTNFRPLFLLLLFFLPLSTEVELPGGFGTDLPTEPLMVGLMVIFGLYVLRHPMALPAAFLRHPLTLLLLLHVGWIYCTTLMSDLFVVSLKFSLAKTWYLVVFFFLAGYVLRRPRDVRRWFWVIYWPLMLMVGYVMVRHAAIGFSFAEQYTVFWPFQRNHVNYAAQMALFYPFIALALGWYPRYSGRWWLLAGTLVFLFVAIYFSFTRAAYIALLAALGAYYVFRWRLIRPVLALVFVVALAGIVYMIRDNRYLDYAPNFETTVSHDEFGNLIEATYKMEDISTMERVYRWVAGGQMIPYRPVTGWGPGNFTSFYDGYAVTSFRTYVSENEERSGIHSYYLMTLVEQGFPGLFFFLLLVFYTLIRGERIYHRAQDPDRRRIIMMVLLSTVVIDVFLIINDLIETDKIGTFFFMNLAMLVNMEIADRKNKWSGQA